MPRMYATSLFIAMITMGASLPSSAPWEVHFVEEKDVRHDFDLALVAPLADHLLACRR